MKQYLVFAAELEISSAFGWENFVGNADSLDAARELVLVLDWYPFIYQIVNSATLQIVEHQSVEKLEMDKPSRKRPSVSGPTVS